MTLKHEGRGWVVNSCEFVQFYTKMIYFRDLKASFPLQSTEVDGYNNFNENENSTVSCDSRSVNRIFHANFSDHLYTIMITTSMAVYSILYYCHSYLYRQTY